jgi:hypothetical protein
MADPAAVVSALAAVLSAIGGAVAAIAAFRSAGSARDAREAAQVSEKRSALRQLTVTANEVLVEVWRVESRAAELKLSYRTLSTFEGSFGGSRETLYLGEVDRKVATIVNVSEAAKPFASGQDHLMNGPVEEIAAREIKISQLLTEARAIREDLEREHASVQVQCATYREKAIQGKRM